MNNNTAIQYTCEVVKAALKNSQPTQANDLTDSEEILYHFLFGLVSLVGTIGNGLVVYVGLRQRSMRRSARNVFITNLAIADFIAAATVIPFVRIPMVMSTWIYGSAACGIFNAFSGMNVFCSALTVVAIAADRYVAVRRIRAPVKGSASISSGVCSKMWPVLIMAFGIWAVSFLCALPVGLFYDATPRELLFTDLEAHLNISITCSPGVDRLFYPTKCEYKPPSIAAIIAVDLLQTAFLIPIPFFGLSVFNVGLARIVQQQSIRRPKHLSVKPSSGEKISLRPLFSERMSDTRRDIRNSLWRLRNHERRALSAKSLPRIAIVENTATSDHLNSENHPVSTDPAGQQLNTLTPSSSWNHDTSLVSNYSVDEISHNDSNNNSIYYNNDRKTDNNNNTSFNNDTSHNQFYSVENQTCNNHADKSMTSLCISDSPSLPKRSVDQSKLAFIRKKTKNGADSVRSCNSDRSRTSECPSKKVVSSQEGTRARQRRLTILLSAMTLSHAVLWLPFTALSWVFDLYPEVISGESRVKYLRIDIFTQLLAYASLTVNPLLYAFLNTNYSREFKRIGRTLKIIR